MADKKIPIRMCVSCREHLPKNNLIRIVKNKEGTIFIDKTFKAQGRGIYVCNSLQCIEKLIKTKGLNRALKCQIDEKVYEEIKGEIFGNTTKK